MMYVCTPPYVGGGKEIPTDRNGRDDGVTLQQPDLALRGVSISRQERQFVRGCPTEQPWWSLEPREMCSFFLFQSTIQETSAGDLQQHASA